MKTSVLRILVLSLSLAFFWSAANAESSLPPCPENPDVTWTNCVGTLTFADGTKYVGEWKDDKSHGQGTLTSADGDLKGDKYVGEFRDNEKNGHGTYTYADGSQYVGEWKDDKPVVPPTTTYDAAPTYGSGGTSTSPDVFLTDVLPGLILGIFLLLLFLALREVFCWYWKINERIRLEKQIVDLLMKQNAKTDAD